MKSLLLGLAARVPLLDGRVVNRGTGGTDRAGYCYGVWLKHLTLLHASGHVGVPTRVAELGPGDSLGVGLAALLSGADHVRALDVKRFSDPERNERVLTELVELFRRRAGRPTPGWPDFDAHLDERLFPAAILDGERLERALAPARLEAIREALRDGVSRDGTISLAYAAPWEDADVIERGSVDLILSHSVLEHVRDLDRTYAACARWLAPGGWMSHQIDLQSHGLARAWNGAWAIGSERYWELIAGRRDCWINRRPASAHLTALERAGFRVTLALRNERRDGVPRERLASRWRDLADDDLVCAGLFVQARPGAAQGTR
jgi:SAM-dependent methyltransferase